jgi:hypothetical protein
MLYPANLYDRPLIQIRIDLSDRLLEYGRLPDAGDQSIPFS